MYMNLGSILNSCLFVMCLHPGTCNEESFYGSTQDLSIEYLELAHMKSKYGWAMFPVISNSSVPFPVYDNCIAYLHEFGTFAAKFIKCTIEKARPLRFCEECVVNYQKTMTLYEDILEDDEDNDGCNGLLLNADRIQVLHEIYNNIVQIWREANCAVCFSDVTEDSNGTVIFKYSQDTTEFLERYRSVYRCIDRHIHPSPMLIQQDEKNDSVCQVCRQNYTQLNKFYKKTRDKKHQVCMDLVDMMNYTRLMWGKTLHCSRHHPDNAPVIIIAVILLLFPFVFYCMAKYCVVRTKRKLMLQKRMSQMAAQSLFIQGPSISKDSEERLLLS